MAISHGEFERIRSVVAKADVDGPLTAREILALLEAADEGLGSAHEVATVLGRHAESGSVEIVRTQPYRYRFAEGQS